MSDTMLIYPGPGDPSVQYKGYGYGRWMSPQGGHRVLTRGELNLATGKINGVTVTINAVQITGFHSGTWVFCYDTNGIPISPSFPVVRGEADATGLGNHTPVERTNAWSFQVDPSIAAKTETLVIIVADDPDGMQEIIDKVLGVKELQQLTPLVTAVGGLFAGKSTSKSTPTSPTAPTSTTAPKPTV